MRKLQSCVMLQPMDDTLSTAFAWFATVALAIALAAAAGLRAWLPLFAAGLLSRLGIANLGESFGWLASWPALGLFGIATLLEVAGDKIPVVDHVLDVIGTVLRPLAGSLAAAAALVQVQDPLVAIVIGLIVGVPASLAPHAAKSSIRAVSTGTTAGIANPLLSLVEDAVSLFITLLAFLAPVLVLLMLAFFGWFTWRWIRGRRPAYSR